MKYKVNEDLLLKQRILDHKTSLPSRNRFLILILYLTFFFLKYIIIKKRKFEKYDRSF